MTAKEHQNYGILEDLGCTSVLLLGVYSIASPVMPCHLSLINIHLELSSCFFFFWGQ